MNKNKKNYIIYKIIIICILFLGIFLRTKYFLNFRWLWADEIALLTNIYNAPLTNSFMPLQFAQSAPPLFLFLSQLILYFFKFITNYHVQSLRIIPFICSIVSIPAFYLLSKKFLNNKICLIISNLLFCFNIHLIYFAQDFKQYSSDVCTFIIVLISYFFINLKEITKTQIILLSLFYIMCSWFSITSIFAIITILFVLTSNKDFKSNIKKYIILTIPFLFNLILVYLSQKHSAYDIRLISFWYKGFINIYDPSSFISIIYNAINYYFKEIPLLNSTIYLLTFFIGIFICTKNLKNEKNQLLILPIFFMYIASLLQIYPFEGRTALYLFPIFIILICSSINYINSQNLKQIILIIFVIFNISNILKYQELFIFKTGNLNNIINEYLTDAKFNLNKSSIILNNLDAVTYTFYNQLYKFNPKSNFIELNDINTININLLPANQTYYVICSNGNNHPDLTSNITREIYHNKLIKNIKSANNIKILKIHTDTSGNILIKFKK